MGFRTWSITSIGIFITFCIQAQNGGDQVGMLGTRFDRLNKGSGMLASATSSKALGVYDASLQPDALLEINSSASHYSWLHPNLRSRGELFRTSAPGTVTANWRFFQGGNEMARLWSEVQNDDLQIRAPNGALRLWGSDTDPAAFQMETMRIWGAANDGGVSINEDNAVKAMPRIALLNLGTYVGYGQRPWMENGLFAGVASDGLYLGMKQEDGDHNDAVLNWNDNADSLYRDHFRFLFTQKGNAGTDASGPHGLEMARFDPGNGEERNDHGADPENGGFGIGNFYTPNGADHPVTARLDVRRGDVRIRELPHLRDPRAERVVVVRPNGILRVRNASSFGVPHSVIDTLKKRMAERSRQLDTLQERIAALKDSLNTDKSRSRNKGAEKSGLQRILRSDRALKGGGDQLAPNHPNPFEDATTFSYELEEDADVAFFISDQRGHRIRTLLKEEQAAGTHELVWKPSGIAPGIYYYTLRVDGMERVRKAIKLE